MSRLMTKPTIWHVRPAKTQISRGIHPVWSESSLSAWRKLGSWTSHWAHSEDSDQTGRMPRLIWVFDGRTVIFLVLSWGGSIISNLKKKNVSFGTFLACWLPAHLQISCRSDMEMEIRKEPKLFCCIILLYKMLWITRIMLNKSMTNMNHVVDFSFTERMSGTVSCSKADARWAENPVILT